MLRWGRLRVVEAVVGSTCRGGLHGCRLRAFGEETGEVGRRRERVLDLGGKPLSLLLLDSQKQAPTRAYNYVSNRLILQLPLANLGLSTLSVPSSGFPFSTNSPRSFSLIASLFSSAHSSSRQVQTFTICAARNASSAERPDWRETAAVRCEVELRVRRMGRREAASAAAGMVVS